MKPFPVKDAASLFRGKPHPALFVGMDKRGDARADALFFGEAGERSVQPAKGLGIRNVAKPDRALGILGKRTRQQRGSRARRERDDGFKAMPVAARDTTARKPDPQRPVARDKNRLHPVRLQTRRGFFQKRGESHAIEPRQSAPPHREPEVAVRGLGDA